MAIRKLFIFILSASFFVFVIPVKAQKNYKNINSIPKNVKHNNKTIKLKYGFQIIVNKEGEPLDSKYYSHLVIKRHGKTIFRDKLKDTLNEYEFKDKLYPIIDSLNGNTFEILVEVNDRPSKSYLRYFKIVNDKILKIKELPTFFGKAANLDNDSNLEYAGIRDLVEFISEEKVYYNPILYYEITSNGIVLDSVLTIRKNKYIYGRFMGFRSSENKVVSNKKTNLKIDKEIARIMKACK